METYLFYGIAILAFFISFCFDKQKTKAAVKKAWKSLENILPQLLTMLLLVSVFLAFVNTDIISKVIGNDSSWLGVIMAALIGSITMIPAFVAFPTAAMLLEAGAGYMQIGAFVSTLMTVGVATIPVESKYFGKRLTLSRNILAFFFSFFVAFVILKVVG
ncbi:permease [Oscillospiraceae bacterium LTW-04]|nr:permease [Oscillospiraceae bacterium MB24-C1]